MVKLTRWTRFTKGKVGKYMKSEGSHKKAMGRLSEEYKKKYGIKK